MACSKGPPFAKTDENSCHQHEHFTRLLPKKAPPPFLAFRQCFKVFQRNISLEKKNIYVSFKFVVHRPLMHRPLMAVSPKICSLDDWLVDIHCKKQFPDAPIVGKAYLEDDPRTCKWLITMVNTLRIRLFPFQMAMHGL